MKDLTNLKPSFCFITPTSYLEQFAGQSNTHLVLAHLVATDEIYASFYKKMSERGDYIMMDNSAYELKVPYSPEKLVELGNKCGADVIVLPDYPFQHSSVTIEAAQKFIPLFKQAGFGTFFVPQSMRGDVDDFCSAYSWAANNPDVDVIGLSILGIPTAISWCDPSYARVVMCQMLIERGLFNKNKRYHHLGLNSGPALEIPTLLRMGVLDTIDSSGPVFAGIQGHRYTPDADSFQMVSKLKAPVDFAVHLTKDNDTLERIQNNVTLTLSLFDEKVYNANKDWFAKE